MELSAKDLRIGNWYNSVKFNQHVTCELSDLRELYIMSDGAYNDPPIDEMFEPIPLTEEWAIEFGYECLVEMACDYSDESKYDIEITSVDLVGLMVHEAQNLYLDLTGKELEIKQS